jgi:hypothetical protein
MRRGSMRHNLRNGRLLTSLKTFPAVCGQCVDKTLPKSVGA